MTLMSQFRNSIRRGTGHAVLLSMAHPELDFSDEIIYACTHRVVYEAQSSDDRSKYYWHLINLSGKQKKILNTLSKTLQNKKEDWYVLELIFSIFGHFAKEGRIDIHQQILNAFTPNHIIENGDCGLDTIIELDGIEGVFFVSSIIGKALQLNSEYWEDGSYIDLYKENHSDIDIYTALSKAAKKNSDIAYLIKYVSEFKALHPRKILPKERLSYEKVQRRIIANDKFIVYYRERNDLTLKEVSRIVVDFKKEKSTALLKKYLQIFRIYPYLGKIEDLFTHLSHSLLRDQALVALANCTSPKIRSYALENIEIAQHPAIYADLLKLNFKQSDLAVLYRISNKLRSLDKIECFARSCISIYEKNTDVDFSNVFVVLYTKMNCAICRYQIIGILAKRNTLPGWIRNEIKYDAYEQTRNLISDSNGFSIKVF